MKRVVQSGGYKYLETEIPRIYHGIVKRKYMESSGEGRSLFWGIESRYFAALAIANFTKNVVSIDYPLTIAGVSESSGSAQSAREIVLRILRFTSSSI